MTGKVPPAHFSDQDPWRAYRVAQLQAPRRSLLQSSVQLDQAHQFTPNALDVCLNQPLYLAWPAWPLQAVLAPLLPTPQAPQAPQAPVKIKNSSNFRGVIWDMTLQTWRARIKLKGKVWYLGLHKDEGAAARAYDAASWFMYGPKGSLNFSDVDYNKLGPPRPPPLWLVQHLVQLVCLF
jgi:hypothetical protein